MPGSSRDTAPGAWSWEKGSGDRMGRFHHPALGPHRGAHGGAAAHFAPQQRMGSGVRSCVVPPGSPRATSSPQGSSKPQGAAGEALEENLSCPPLQAPKAQPPHPHEAPTSQHAEPGSNFLFTSLPEPPQLSTPAGPPSLQPPHEKSHRGHAPQAPAWLCPRRNPRRAPQNLTGTPKGAQRKQPPP